MRDANATKAFELAQIAYSQASPDELQYSAQILMTGHDLLRFIELWGASASSNSIIGAWNDAVEVAAKIAMDGPLLTSAGEYLYMNDNCKAMALMIASKIRDLKSATIGPVPRVGGDTKTGCIKCPRDPSKVCGYCGLLGAAATPGDAAKGD